MTQFLQKFTAKVGGVRSAVGRQRCGTLATGVGIGINLLLFAGKFMIGMLTASLAITADAWNNLSDAGSSAVSMACFRVSAKPADREHPFGHARMEYVASMIVSFLVLLIGVELIRDSFGKILHSETATHFRLVAVVVLGISVLLKLGLFFFYRSVGNAIDSETLRAAATDSLSDVLSTGAVLVSTLVFRFTGWDPDAYVGLLVGAVILWNGIKILNETKNHILGAAPDPEFVQKLTAQVRSHPEILGIHDMAIHTYGAGMTFVSFHAEVDASENILDSHDVIDNIEREIADAFHAVCNIHLDPIVIGDARMDALRQKAQEIAAAIGEGITVHDVRMVTGNTHTNLIFDMAVPFEIKMQDDMIVETMCRKMAEEDPTLFCVITVDRS